MKKAMVPMLTLCLAATFGLIGCNKKKDDGDKKKGGGSASAIDCDLFAKKMSQCADTLIDVQIAGKVPADQMAQVKEKAKKKFTTPRLLKKCKKESAKGQRDPKEQEGVEQMKACLAKDSCKEFAACFVKVTRK